MWAITKFLGTSKALDPARDRQLDVSQVNGEKRLSVMEDASLRLGRSRKRGEAISLRDILGRK